LFRTQIEKIHAISGGEYFYIGNRGSQFQQAQYVQIGNGMNLTQKGLVAALFQPGARGILFSGMCSSGINSASTLLRKL